MGQSSTHRNFLPRFSLELDQNFLWVNLAPTINGTVSSPAIYAWWFETISNILVEVLVQLLNHPKKDVKTEVT